MRLVLNVCSADSRAGGLGGIKEGKRSSQLRASILSFLLIFCHEDSHHHMCLLRQYFAQVHGAWQTYIGPSETRPPNKLPSLMWVLPGILSQQ